MIEIYHGDGKGKTTAAAGLAIRAAGHGISVIFAQFLKDGSSGEIDILKNIPGITILHSDCFFGFVRNMTEQQKQMTRQSYETMINKTEEIIYSKLSKVNTGNTSDVNILVVLDEVLHACNYGLLDEGFLISRLKKWQGIKPENREETEKPHGNIEIVLTGRNPSEALCHMADYITFMKKEKHPYDHGVYARCGIEM